MDPMDPDPEQCHPTDNSVLQHLFITLVPSTGTGKLHYTLRVPGDPVELVPQHGRVETLPPRRGSHEAGDGGKAELHRRRLIRRRAGRGI